jgi:hypothetical protein
LCCGSFDELFELILCRGLDCLVVYSVFPISDGLADEFAFAEAQTAIDDDKVCGLGLVAVRELITFDVPIHELFHTPDYSSTQIEAPILEITISEI